jgi:hypothetical protein
MRRHELDPVSLIFGFVFAGLGLLFLVGQADQALRLHWIWPLLLIVLGVAILIDVSRNRDRVTDTPDREAATAEPDRDPDVEEAVDDREHPR